MMKKLSLTILLLIISIVNFSQTTPKGVGTLSMTQDNTTATKAFVIGISEYENVQSLNYAHSDALSFYNYLRSDAGGKLDSSNIVLLLNKEATSANIYGGLDWLIAEVEENDKVIIYFSGHGDLETKTIAQHGFLLGYNSPKYCYPAGGTIQVTMLKSYIETLAKKNKASIILITDACRSGKLAGGTEGVKNTSAALAENWHSIIKVLSSQPGELSVESEKWGNGAGVFTFYLINGLTGLADNNKDNEINVFELQSYLNDNIPRETQFSQFPSISGNPTTTLSFVDSLALANLTVDINSNYQDQLAYKGFNDYYADQLDEDIYNQYEMFNVCIEDDILIPGNTHLMNAWDIYEDLRDNPEASVIIKKLHRTLLAALQNKAQVLINKYLEAKAYDHDFTISQAANEMDYAYQLIDSSYILHDQIFARHLFLKSTQADSLANKISLLKKAIEIEPYAAYHYNEIGTKYASDNNHTSAISNYLEAIELAPQWPYPYYNLGIAYDELEKKDKAAEAYLKAIEIKPDYTKAYYNLGITYDDMEEYDNAIEAYMAAIEISPDYFKAYYNLGVSYNNMEEYDNAVSAYLTAIEISPDYDDAYYNLGIAYDDMEKYDKAVEAYLKAIEINPDYYKAYLNLGNSYDDMEEYDNAVEAYLKAIEINPDYDKAYLNLGSSYHDMEEYDKAVEAYLTAIEIKPDYLLAYSNLGRSYRNQNLSKKAIECYLTAYSIDTSYYYAFFNIGNIYFDKRAYDSAIIYFTKKIELSPEDKYSWFNIGLCHKLQSNYHTAIAYYEKSIKIAPEYLRPYKSVEDIYRNKLNDYNKALFYIKKAIELEPDNAENYKYLGINYLKVGQNKNAIEAYLNAYNFDTTYSNAFFKIGNIYFSQQAYDTAIIYFSKGIEIFPNDEYSLYNIGLCYKLLSNYDSAIAHYQRSIEIAPDYLRPYKSMKDIYSDKLQDYESAQFYIKKIVELEPDNAANFEALAYNYLRLNKPEKALENFKKAIEMDPENAWYYYDICCYFAIQEDIKNSLVWFEKSLKKGFYNWEHLETDTDIDFIRNTPEFKELINKYKN